MQNNIAYDINIILSTYGIIDIENLYNIYNNIFQKIEKNKFLKEIKSLSKTDDNIQLLKYNNNILVGNYAFIDKETAYHFYKQTKGTYKQYTKEEYYNIDTGKYLKNKTEYQELINILNKYKEITNIDYYIELILLDYISLNQTSHKDATKLLNYNISKEMPFLTKEDIIKLKELIKKLENKYPSWNLNGHTKEE